MKKANVNTYQINGRVIDDQSRRGIAGLRVEAWDKDLVISDLVGSDRTDEEGKFRIEFSRSYFTELFLDRKPDLFFKVFADDELIKSTQDSILWNVPAGTTPVEIVVSFITHEVSGNGHGSLSDDGDYTISGIVASPDRAGVGGLRVELVDKNVGQDIALGETNTDDRGRYKLSFSSASLRKREKTHPDLQARVFANGTFIGASEIRYNANHEESLNVALPANSTALGSEHETLVRALATHFTGKLRDLKESAEHQDITYLANKTGWDARAVALAALADQFSRHSTDQQDKPSIAPAFYYALFRAGLPANPDTLYRANVQTVKAVWQKAVKQGVIAGATSQEVEAAAKSFQKLSAEKLLTAPALTGASSLKALLDVSRLNETEQTKFAELYTEHRQDRQEFWTAIKNEFGEKTADRLQVNGKLSLVTLNNAPLISALHTAAGADGVSDPVQLAQNGLHRPTAWLGLLDDTVAIPNEIPGDNPQRKRTNYAEYLAAQVRISYPTASVAEMVGSGDLAVKARDNVHGFLREHQGEFEIGVMPVGQYVARKNLTVSKETLTEVKQIERVYQITPSDQAMNALMKRGVHAAAEVVRFDKQTFIETFAKEMGGGEIAAHTYDRSLQVHNAVLNIAMSYIGARNGVEVGLQPMQSRGTGVEEAGNHLGEGLILSPQPKLRGGGENVESDVIAYPTLEELFGQMDFCACDHCRSILSPAAYLVDLLLFIEQAPRELEPGKENALTVFRERRPDIENLPLTCENTNTALPYIDVVNETLEYFIANAVQRLSLQGYLGHDTGQTASEDLLASPQFVMDSAYTTLRTEPFPTLLPFHQSLENLRRHFDKFEVPLPLAMERLRKNDQLERGTNEYGWRDILMEQLRLSRDEHGILTSAGANPLWRIYGMASGTSNADAVIALSNAKQFSRRLGITYEDLVEILKTRFVNPNSDLVPKLERLGVPFAALQALKDGTLSDADFDDMLPTGAGTPDPAQYDGNIKAWVKKQENFDRIMTIITLVDPSAEPDPCNFDKLEFRFAKPMANPDDTSTRLGDVEFVRLLRFIRLWKKLGWTIEQTDTAICALFPVPPFPLGEDAIDTTAKLDAGFRLLLPRLGLVMRIMKELNLTTKRDLLPLLTLWSPLGIHGESALYRQMFLSPSMLAQDAAFGDNGYGEFLVDETEKLMGHTETLRAAFAMTGDEFEQVVTALGFETNFVSVAYTHSQPTLSQVILDTAPGIGYDNTTHQLSYTGMLTATTRDALKAIPGVTAAFELAVDALYAANQTALTDLTLDNISAVYSSGWLARKLKISVRELLLLKRVTGLDPFATPDATNPAILRIIELVHALQASSLKSAEALYLIWNQDLSGKSVPDPAQTTEFARTLRNDFAAIDDQFAATEDPGGNIARARMTLVYGSEVTDAFFALLEDTIVLDVAYTHPQPALEPAIVAADSRIAYDDFRHRFSYTGLLSTTNRDALKAAGPAPSFQSAVDAIFAKSEDARGSFFSRHPELRPLFDAYVASSDPIETKRRALLAAFSPELSKRRKRQQALQRLSAAANTDLSSTQTLLDPTPPFPLHASGNVNQPALDDFIAIEKPGLAVSFFFRDTATGTVDLNIPAEPNVDYSAGRRPLPANPTPGAAISGIWTGKVETPETGFYNFVVEVDSGATVTLSLDGQVRALTPNGTIWRNSDPLELAGGALHEIVLTVNRVLSTLSLKWETPKRKREVIPGRYLYPPASLPPFNDAYVRFFKTASLAQALRLTANELSRFATHSDYQIAGDGWLNALAVTGEPAPTAAAALLRPLRDLLDFAHIKTEISPEDESLITLLRDPATGETNGLLYTLTRWDKASANSLLAHFGISLADLAHFDQFRRVYDVFRLLQKMGILASALIKGTTNEPSPATVVDLQAALRARYETESWRSVVQPINDEMRALQRDALVAYILHQMSLDGDLDHIDTADKLFEYFLMDVQMAPCMQTSRIRHALSSVQLFIERCFMNLEPRVSFIPPSLIQQADGAPNKAKQWEWMKRYRVWEANRKVFLFPENWLEPELRDDKSPFFKEVESELLQGDITEEKAAVALLNYLSKLEEVAKLEPCGIHHAPANQEQRTGEVNHVIARTAGASRKYYYRRFEYGYWTPWEVVKLDIEDNPVMPVVWKGRLLLFWLRILKEAPVDPTKLPDSPGPTGPIRDLTLSAIRSDANSKAQQNARVRAQAVLCWSEYYNGKWQPAKTSEIERPLQLDRFDAAGSGAFNRSKLQLRSYELANGTLAIHVGGQGSGTFFMHNTHSLPVRAEDATGIFAFELPEPFRGIDLTDAEVVITYGDGLLYLDPGGGLSGQTFNRKVLENQFLDRVVEPDHPMPDRWDAPFFYEDGRHVFYVTTTEKLVEIPIFTGVAVDPGDDETEFIIPPFVVEDKPLEFPDLDGGDPFDPGFLVNPAEARRFITEDANIRQGIGATGSIKFGDIAIGPQGAIKDSSVKI